MSSKPAVPSSHPSNGHGKEGRTVILWVHPRSTSTAFECALLNRKEFRVLHEPMGDAFYFGPERVSNRYPPEKCAESHGEYKASTYKTTWSNIVTPPPPEVSSTDDTPPLRTFSKDMAQYIFNQASTASTIHSVPSCSGAEDGDFTPFNDNPTLLPSALLLDPSIIHTFLIRTPQKAVPSYHRLCYPGSETGFDYFDPEEAGYRELRMLFDFLKEVRGGRKPFIVDSEDLLRDPEGVMELWCKEVGIEFDPAMLSWDEGTREHFKKWPGFHTCAENSSGIGKGLSKDYITPANHQDSTFNEASAPAMTSTSGGKTGLPAPPELPKVVKDCIEANMQHYEYLKSFVRKPDPVISVS